MDTLGFLVNNFRWTFSRAKGGLLATPTDEERLFAGLSRLAGDAPTGRRKVNLYPLSFDLDEVFLTRADSEEKKFLKGLLPHYQNLFQRLQRTLTGDFPVCGGEIRMQKIARWYVTATQNVHGAALLARYKAEAAALCRLTDAETLHFDDFLALCGCEYFCETFRYVQKHDGRFFLARLTETSDLLRAKYTDAEFYAKTSFKNKRLFAVVDCFANSSVLFDNKRANVALSMKVSAGGRNVFDTFVQYKFGEKTANFRAQTSLLDLTEQYFIKECCEIRKCFFLSKAKRQTCFEFAVEIAVDGQHPKYFAAENAHCVGIGGENARYVAFAFAENNTIVPCEAEYCEGDSRIRLQMKRGRTLSPRQAWQLHVVTVYADDMEHLLKNLSRLRLFGYCDCDDYADNVRQGQVYPVHTNVRDAASRLSEPQEKPEIKNARFTYRFGNADISTFLDVCGNGATVLNGFVCGVGGDLFYGVRRGRIAKLNAGTFSVLPDGIAYTSGDVALRVRHDDKKHYEISAPAPQRFLWILPLEEKSVVTRTDDGFRIVSKTRDFNVTFDGKAESFTTNAIECNAARLRCNLSGDLVSGQCLALCFAPAATLHCTLSNNKKTPAPQPLIGECLLSAYLNCINDKNAFCLANRLMRADALTLSALTYTNPAFVRAFVENAAADGCVQTYYDASGRLRTADISLSVVLALLYLTVLTGDKTCAGKYARLISETLKKDYAGKDLCIKALALKKLAEADFDKVNSLIEYGKIRKKIVGDKNLYGPAQAVGAVEMTYPSKQRLKDLASRWNLPKCWYYVSQLENLYGLRLACGKLRIKPTVSTADLEQFVLTRNGKKMDVSFAESVSKSIEVNGVDYFQSVALSLLPQNTSIVVKV